MADAPVYHDGSSETTPTSRLEWPVNTFNVQIFENINNNRFLGQFFPDLKKS